MPWMELTLTGMFEQSKHFTTASPPACSCPGWKWRHRCRHVDELRRALELVAAVEKKWAEKPSQVTRFPGMEER